MTALHVAGHLTKPKFLFGDDRKAKIMRYLIEKGADPSVLLTSMGYPMWELVGCDEKAVLFLIEKGIGLDQPSPLTKKTILHYWVCQTTHYRSLDIVKLLLERGVSVNLADNNGITALHLAALGASGNLNERMFELLLKQEEVSGEEKVLALELIGSTLITKRHYERGWHFWQRADNLRIELELVKNPFTVSATAIEFVNLEELAQMRSNLAECSLQSILVRQRILRPLSVKAVMSHQWPGVKSFCRDLVAKNDVVRLLDISWMMLEIAFNPLEKFAREIVMDVINNIVLVFRHQKQSTSKIRLSRDIIFRTLRLVVDANPYYLVGFDTNLVAYDMPSDTDMDLICELLSLVAGFLPDGDKEMIQCLQKLVEHRVRDCNGRTILHVVCSLPSVHVYTAVQLLLQAGADPDAVDKLGNSPLHVLARNPVETLESPTAELLLDAGTHRDRVNAKEQTAVDVYYRRFKKPAPSWDRKVLPLTCLSARVIRQHKISLFTAKLDPKLQTIIKTHWFGCYEVRQPFVFDQEMLKCLHC